MTLCDLPIKTLLTSQLNQIYSEASSTHFSAINLSYFTLYPLNYSWIYIKSPTFQKTIRVIAEHNSIWHSVIYQSKHFSPPNAIKYILKHLQHTFKLLIYHTLTLYPSYSSLLQIHHYISENYQTSRGTQFNLTHCDLPIKTLLTSQRNQIYSEASSTHFSANNLSYLTLYSSKCSLLQIHHYISENYQTSRRTQFNLTLCDLPIKTLLTSQRNQLYSEASSTHFSVINLSYLRFTN